MLVLLPSWFSIKIMSRNIHSSSNNVFLISFLRNWSIENNFHFLISFLRNWSNENNFNFYLVSFLRNRSNENKRKHYESYSIIFISIESWLLIKNFSVWKYILFHTIYQVIRIFFSYITHHWYQIFKKKN